MNAFPSARAVGVVIFLLVGVMGSNPAGAIAPTPNQDIAAMLETIFAPVAPAEQVAVVYKDDRERVYLAFYMSTYADVKELRAYSITYRNVSEFADEQANVDALIAAGNYAEAFDGLLNVMRLDLGSQYVSDVGLDGVHEGTVAVGEGSMKDRYHNQVFADHAAANAAYMRWLERAVALAGN